MEFTFRQPVPARADVAYDVLHDRFTDLPARLPNLLAIVELSRQPGESEWKTTHRWKADPEVIPGIARPFVKPSLLEWTGYATWKRPERSVNFVFESDWIRELYDCSGTFLIHPRGDEAEIDIVVRLNIHASKIPAVPRMLAGKIASVVENTLVGAVKPSLAELPAAVTHYVLERQRSGHA